MVFKLIGLLVALYLIFMRSLDVLVAIDNSLDPKKNKMTKNPGRFPFMGLLLVRLKNPVSKTSMFKKTYVLALITYMNFALLFIFAFFVAYNMHNNLLLLIFVVWIAILALTLSIIMDVVKARCLKRLKKEGVILHK